MDRQAYNSAGHAFGPQQQSVRVEQVERSGTRERKSTLVDPCVAMRLIRRAGRRRSRRGGVNGAVWARERREAPEIDDALSSAVRKAGRSALIGCIHKLILLHIEALDQIIKLY
jgi:hypothetical protein